MSDQDHLRIVPSPFHQLSQPQPDLSGPSFHLAGKGVVLGALGLVVPARPDQPEVDLLAELGLERLRIGADVAGHERHLLGVRERDDLLARLDDRREGAQAGQQSPANRGGDEMGDLVVRVEVLAERHALGLAQGREERVFQPLGLQAEVVVTLSVSHQVYNRGHVEVIRA